MIVSCLEVLRQLLALCDHGGGTLSLGVLTKQSAELVVSSDQSSSLLAVPRVSSPQPKVARLHIDRLVEPRHDLVGREVPQLDGALGTTAFLDLRHEDG